MSKYLSRICNTRDRGLWENLVANPRVGAKMAQLASCGHFEENAKNSNIFHTLIR